MKAVGALGTLIAALLWSGVALGQEASPRAPSGDTDVVERAVASFAPGAVPSRVLVRASHATITIVGHDESEVRAEARLAGDPSTGALGLRVSRTAGLVAVELPEDLPSGANLVVEAPRGVALEIRGANGGPITVVGVEGEIDVENSNAGVKLLDVVGPVVAATSNGPIEVRFRRIARGLPMSFVTSNGAIDVTLPDEVAADLLIQTDTGSVRSEFPIEPDTTGGRPGFGPPGGPDPPRPGRVIRGSIGGGGPLFRFWTDNADVILRRHD